jgi:hypothetical protein
LISVGRSVTVKGRFIAFPAEFRFGSKQNVRELGRCHRKINAAVHDGHRTRRYLNRNLQTETNAKLANRPCYLPTEMAAAAENVPVAADEAAAGAGVRRVARVLIYQAYRTSMDRRAMLKIAAGSSIIPAALDSDFAVEYCYELGTGVLPMAVSSSASGTLSSPTSRLHLCLPPAFGVLVEQGLLRPGTEAIAHYEKVTDQHSIEGLVGAPMLLVTHVKLVGVRHAVALLSPEQRDRALAAVSAYNARASQLGAACQSKIYFFLTVFSVCS